MFSTIMTFINAAIIQGIPLLFGSTGEIITEKSGNLNLGIPGIMYVGGISGIIGGYLYEHSTENPVPILCILISFFSCVLGSVLLSLIYSFLTVSLRANQNVTGLALTTFGVGIGNFFGGSLLTFSAKAVQFRSSKRERHTNPISPLPIKPVYSGRHFFPSVFLHILPLLLHSSVPLCSIAQESD